MDTDSMYMGLSTPTLEEAVPEEYRDDFNRAAPSFLVTKPEDNRKTGLFKVECK